MDTYGWSHPPGLREKADELGQIIRGGGGGSTLQRTASSSSSISVTKVKRKKIHQKTVNFDDVITLNEETASQSSSAVNVSGNKTADSTVKDVSSGQDSSSNGSTTSNSVSASSTMKANVTTLDTDSLQKENAALREKVLALQDELLYQRETSMGKP